MAFARLAARLVAPLLAALAVLRARASRFGDATDVEISMYRDPDCFPPAAQTLTLRQNSCYANVYSPNISKGFRTRLVSYPVGSSAPVASAGTTDEEDEDQPEIAPGDRPQLFQVDFFADSCEQGIKAAPTMYAKAGACEQFAGAFWGVYKTKIRSDTCRDQCSALTIGVQRIFGYSGCRGNPQMIFRYPAGNQCLRIDNGTQAFVSTIKPAVVDEDGIKIPAGLNLTVTRYMGSQDCSAVNADVSTYSMNAGECHELPARDVNGHALTAVRSFRWDIEKVTPLGSISGALGPSLVGASLVPLAAFARLW